MDFAGEKRRRRQKKDGYFATQRLPLTTVALRQVLGSIHILPKGFTSAYEKPSYQFKLLLPQTPFRNPKPSTVPHKARMTNEQEVKSQAHKASWESKPS